MAQGCLSHTYQPLSSYGAPTNRWGQRQPKRSSTAVCTSEGGDSSEVYRTYCNNIFPHTGAIHHDLSSSVHHYDTPKHSNNSQDVWTYHHKNAFDSSQPASLGRIFGPPNAFSTIKINHELDRTDDPASSPSIKAHDCTCGCGKTFMTKHD